MASPVIVGVGDTTVGRVPGVSSLGMHVQAARAAIRDSGLPKDSIDAVLCGSSYVVGFERQSLAVSEALGLRPRHSNTWQVSGASACAMVIGAMEAINAGLADVVLITCGDNRLSGLGQAEAVTQLAHQRNQEYELPYGPLTASMSAMWCRRHMFVYGTTREQLAQIAVTFRQNAIATGRGHMSKPLTMDDVLSSRLVSSPYRLFDCSPVSDGGAAVIVARQGFGDTVSKPGAKVVGWGEGYWHEHSWCSDDMTTSAAVDSGRRAYETAGVSPTDIDLAEIYDCFTGAFLIQLEDLGFCAKGEAGRYIDEGGLVGGEGTWFNTHGGLLSYGHSGIAGGLYHVIEAVRRLREPIGGRDGTGHRLALVHGMGGIFSSHATIILERV
jgi:acetyl-CoA acetyltransferase